MDQKFGDALRKIKSSYEVRGIRLNNSRDIPSIFHYPYFAASAFWLIGVTFVLVFLGMTSELKCALIAILSIIPIFASAKFIILCRGLRYELELEIGKRRINHIDTIGSLETLAKQLSRLDPPEMKSVEESKQFLENEYFRLSNGVTVIMNIDINEVVEIGMTSELMKPSNCYVLRYWNSSLSAELFLDGVLVPYLTGYSFKIEEEKLDARWIEIISLAYRTQGYYFLKKQLAA